jgi:hypothetical protein
MTDIYVGLGLAFISINFLAWTWLALRFEKANREKYIYRDALGEKNVLIERRLALLELVVKTVPTHHDLSEIRESIHQVAQTMTGVRERLIVNTEMTRSIKKHLLENDP